MRERHGGEVERWCSEFGLRPKEILDFSANANPFGPPVGWEKAVSEALREIARYPDSDSTVLRNQIAEREGVDPECVLVGNGSIELIYLLPKIFEAPPCAMILSPTFSEYGAAVDNARGEKHFVNVYSREHDHARLADLAARADLIFLCNPNNPTGVLYPRATLDLLLELTESAGVTVCVDESFMDFVLAEDRNSLVRQAAKNPHLVVVKSMTKFWGVPGLRLGYAVSHPESIAALRLFKEPWTVNIFAQKAGSFFLENYRAMAEIPERIAALRNQTIQALEKLGAFNISPAAANFLFLECASPSERERLWKDSARQGIFFRNCANFQHCPPALRLGLKEWHLTEKAVKALKEII